MSLPVIAIVGRPNVGKSSLLNMVARERISIVDPRPGITRDRVSTIIEYEGRYLELVDTGGIGIVDADHLEGHVEQQIDYAIQRADVVLFILDTHAGLTPLDQIVSERLRALAPKVVLVANKVDTEQHASEAAQFMQLGFGEPVIVSALHTRGRFELLRRVIDHLGPLTGEESYPETPVMKLAIVGKRNAGKSTLVNALAGEQRVIVSETPGTTRDAVDVRFEKDGRAFVAIDTAGVRKRSSMNDIDFYSHTRALASIRRADVVLLLIDATVPVSEVDLKLAHAIAEEYKPVVLGINKWDLAKDITDSAAFDEYLSKVLPELSYAPIAVLTARDGKNVDAVIDLALSLHNQSRTRLPTARLNEILQQIVDQRAPQPRHSAKRIRLFYATQADVAPPTLVFFSNRPELITENYKRFLENRLRELTPFREVPMRLIFRARGAGTAPRSDASDGGQPMQGVDAAEETGLDEGDADD